VFTEHGRFKWGITGFDCNVKELSRDIQTITAKVILMNTNGQLRAAA